MCRKKKKVNLSKTALKDLDWWKKSSIGSYNEIRSFRFHKTIFSDALLSGWGATCNGKQAHGFWNETEKSQHINCLELLAVLLALKCFASKNRDCQILLRVDNIVAISYINKMGGVKVPYLNKIARTIWKWCLERNIWIFAEYVASKENLADKGSRISNMDTEWELGNYAYKRITEVFGIPDIDLFASRINKKCDRFCFWQRDPDAFVFNALRLDWSEFYGYAFPSFSLIMRTLKKFREDKATGILVVPDWRTQPWYPSFMQMISSSILRFEPCTKLLVSPCRTIEHPLARQLGLIVGVISGKCIGERI
ncbi:uncharacterized protein LOC128879024 [Hylaeus volcanicus]|uniref:uncharacterized protein LOC128879024 n=1 Tax=Hylaeus volcanicus TaxID=313075 RepID=UPI0023B835A6|nr:uncharacterized protein LOC128879024 [Hylaeus volcanicus]XP_053983780.1 uncharacterized protein LOC128879024 [Hylaeus volcanicus]XP_053983781.1 uncharacterized protein LOC128879024 [Hylaeus volcanicus]